MRTCLKIENKERVAMAEGGTERKREKERGSGRGRGRERFILRFTLSANSLACHVDVDKAWDSCLRSKAFYYSLHNSSFMVILAPLASQVPQE